MESKQLTRRAFAAASIVPLSAVRGSAQNSAITVGLIGCGGRGTHDGMLLVKYVKDARLVAVADLFPEKTENAKKAAGVPDAKVYERDLELLQKSGVDAVIIATPVFLHPEHLEAALKAGKHVYIEKPPLFPAVRLSCSGRPARKPAACRGFPGWP